MSIPLSNELYLSQGAYSSIISEQFPDETIKHVQMHLPIPLLSAVKGESLGWEPWSGSLSLTQAAMGQVAIPPPGLELEVTLVILRWATRVARNSINVI